MFKINNYLFIISTNKQNADGDILIALKIKYSNLVTPKCVNVICAII